MPEAPSGGLCTITRLSGEGREVVRMEELKDGDLFTHSGYPGKTFEVQGEPYWQGAADPPALRGTALPDPGICTVTVKRV